METLAGSDRAGFHDGVGVEAIFDTPNGLALSDQGVLYVTDGVIRRIDAEGVVTTFSGDRSNSGLLDGPSEVARFYGPAGLALEREGNLLVVDSANHALRRVAWSDGSVVTLSGNGERGFVNGPLLAARFDSPLFIALEPGTLRAYVSEFGNNAIRVVSLSEGSVDTLAGSGEAGSEDGAGIAARFNAPRGLAVDAEGRVWVADTRNHVIRRITREGQVTTIAGLAGVAGAVDGSGSSARFNAPVGIAIASDGSAYVTEPDNHLIRVVSAGGEVRRFAGKLLAEGTMASSEDGPLETATFASPRAIAVGGDGAVYVVDRRRVRVIR